MDVGLNNGIGQRQAYLVTTPERCRTQDDRRDSLILHCVIIWTTLVAF
jgi:hypothetical protein